MYCESAHGGFSSVIGSLQSISSSRAGGGAAITRRATVVAVRQNVASTVALITCDVRKAAEPRDASAPRQVTLITALTPVHVRCIDLWN
jgi:hypothetical protein